MIEPRLSEHMTIMSLSSMKIEAHENLSMADMTVHYDNRTTDLGFLFIKCNTIRLREDVERHIPDII